MCFVTVRKYSMTLEISDQRSLQSETNTEGSVASGKDTKKGISNKCCSHPCPVSHPKTRLQVTRRQICKKCLPLHPQPERDAPPPRLSVLFL